MTMIGGPRVMAKLRRLSNRLNKELADTNEKNGQDILRIARILHPGDGATKNDMTGQHMLDGSYRIDFGDKAKVTEGDNAPRPFVNPALKVTAKRRKNRSKRAVNKIVKQVFNG